MKRKGFLSRSKYLLKWHVFIFMVVMVLLWLTIPSMTYSPDPAIPGVVVNAKQHTVNLISVTMLWITVLVAHFGLYHIYGWQQREHLTFTRQSPKRYVPTTRLEPDAQEEANILADAETNLQRLQVR